VPVDPPEKVARAVLRCLDRPRRTVVVGPTHRLITVGFRTMPAVYDALVGPLLRSAALSRRPVGPTEGNVLVARPTGESTHGRWGRRWLRPVGAAAVAGAGLTAVTAFRRPGH